MTLKEIADLLKALDDVSRLTIVAQLKKENEICACRLLEAVDCNQSTLSHHMKILVDAQLVNARKDWKWVHYSLNKERLNELKKCLETELWN